MATKKRRKKEKGKRPPTDGKKRRRKKRKKDKGDGLEGLPEWEWYTLALYGPSGIGKTTLAATAPGPVLFLDSNKGLLSLKGRKGLSEFNSFPIGNFEDLEKAYANLTGTGDYNWEGRFNSVVFDHFDDIQGLVLDELTAIAAAKDDRRLRDDPAQREWGIMGNRLKRVLRNFKSLPMHKILIFSVGEDKITGQARPRLSGQLGDQLPYFTDLIGYMKYAKGNKRGFVLEGSEEESAKNRAWWMKNNRRLLKFDDTQFLTNLFQEVTAGPGS